jgi:hypothetical protein
MLADVVIGMVDEHEIASVAALELVHAAAAIKGVVPVAADQQVVAEPAEDLVGALVTGQGVLEVRADNVLEVHPIVALGIVVATAACAEADRDPRPGKLVGHGVDAVTAVHDLVRGSTDDGVIARA